MLVPGRGKGERGPGTRAGQAIGPTTGEAAAPAPGAPTGCPVAPRAIWGWSITPTMMASAPDALSAKVAAWANIVFMGQPYRFSLRRHEMRRVVPCCAGNVPIAARSDKTRYLAGRMRQSLNCNH